ncbi:MAG: hypothetical protein JWM98_1423 [Thermoleophilia bacterium]|nr:hypothetical protein [Thermoleophilia bacterium]
MCAAKAQASSKTTKSSAPAGGDRIGRGTRWTEEQVSLLMEAVKGSTTAKEAFETVAKQLGKSTGTVQQKYYNLQKKAGGGTGRRGRRSASGARSASAAAPAPSSRGRATGGLPGATDLRTITVDELVSLATRVKAEVDRRKSELDAAAKLLSS